MARLLFGIFLIVLFYLAKVLVNGEFAALVLGIMCSAVGLTLKEWSDLLRKVPRGARSGLGRLGQRLAPYFANIDLSFLMLATLLFGVALANSFVTVIEELAAKRMVIFPANQPGFEHFQVYVASYVISPLLFLVCGGYAFFRGFKDRRASFPRILIGVACGLAAAAGFLSLLRGEFTGLQGFRAVTKAPAGEPISAQTFEIFQAVSLGLLGVLALAVYTWLLGQLGRASAWAAERIADRRRRAELGNEGGAQPTGNL